MIFIFLSTQMYAKVQSKVLIILILLEMGQQTYMNLHDNNHKIIVLIAMTAIWTALYSAVHLLYKPKQKLSKKVVLDTKNRAISIVHGIGSFVMASYCFLFNHFNEPNTEFENFILLFSLSYCIYDFVACLIFGLADGGLVLHHSLCVLGFGSALLFDYGAMDSLGGLFVAQVSNFPMHLRVILRNFGLRYTQGYEFFENLYLALYIIARGIICPFFVLIPSLQSQNSPLIVKIICFSLTAQSFYYILQMTKIIRKKMAQFKEMKEKNINYSWFKENEEVKKLSFYKASDGPKIF